MYNSDLHILKQWPPPLKWPSPFSSLHLSQWPSPLTVTFTSSDSDLHFISMTFTSENDLHLSQWPSPLKVALTFHNDLGLSQWPWPITVTFTSHSYLHLSVTFTPDLFISQREWPLVGAVWLSILLVVTWHVCVNDFTWITPLVGAPQVQVLHWQSIDKTQC